jgi:hypothetical protein
MIKNLFRRIRGTLGNAAVWATTWFLAAFPLHVAYWAFGIRYGPFWERAFGVMLTYAGVGFLAGGVFSLYLRIVGRNQRLAQQKPGRVGLGSALTVGVVIPGLFWYFGDPQISALSGILIASTVGAFAGGTALAQVKIAQRALKAGDGGPEELEACGEQLLPASGS